MSTRSDDDPEEEPLLEPASGPPVRPPEHRMMGNPKGSMYGQRQNLPEVTLLPQRSRRAVRPVLIAVLALAAIGALIAVLLAR